MNAYEFLELIIPSLAGGSCKIKEELADESIILTVTIEGNTGSVIGKEGKTIESIRRIAKALGYKNTHQINVQIA